MPWKEFSVMSRRYEFVSQVLQKDQNFSALCRAFGISRKTGYKWLHRFQEGGLEALRDRPRRPHRTPRRTPEAMEDQICAVRQQHPTWGGRKIHAFLRRQGVSSLPSPSTITAILRRRGFLDPEESLKHRPYQRFQRAHPNELWQMDFKGAFLLRGGVLCHPLTLLDDHSRFLVGLYACGDQTRETVQRCLEDAFQRYGFPEALLVDNGSPWGQIQQEKRVYTGLEVWLLRLGIQVVHSRPYHPQTLGKDERLHRTLEEELLRTLQAEDLEGCQREFDRWRRMYNEERPHEALGMDPPALWYERSARGYGEGQEPWVYPAGAQMRKVDVTGRISFRGQGIRVGKAFRGVRVAVYEIGEEGECEIYYGRQRIKRVTLRTNPHGQNTKAIQSKV